MLWVILMVFLYSCSRYIAIVHPLHYSRYMTKVVTRLLMSATWSVALCISCIPIFWNDWEDGVLCEMNEVSLINIEYLGDRALLGKTLFPIAYRPIPS